MILLAKGMYDLVNLMPADVQAQPLFPEGARSKSTKLRQRLERREVCVGNRHQPPLERFEIQESQPPQELQHSHHGNDDAGETGADGDDADRLLLKRIEPVAEIFRLLIKDWGHEAG